MTDVEQEVEEFVHEYAGIFSTGDPSVVAAHFHEPALLVSSEGVSHLASREDVASLFAAVFEDLADRNYGSSEAADVSTIPLGADRALATVDWVRYTENGDVLERLVTTHLFRRTDDNWEMVLLAPHD
ncbi:MAG: DUF4440 domain-containing protein [Haloarculaceae archaeon]